jgi:hypothetical protein
MKPKTQTVMKSMIREIRNVIPFDAPEAAVCSEKNTCQGCSLKLLGYLESELENWEQLLKTGHVPDFKDLQKLEKTAKRIYKTLATNGLV